MIPKVSGFCLCVTLGNEYLYCLGTSTTNQKQQSYLTCQRARNKVLPAVSFTLVARVKGEQSSGWYDLRLVPYLMKKKIVSTTSFPVCRNVHCLVCKSFGWSLFGLNLCNHFISFSTFSMVIVRVMRVTYDGRPKSIKYDLLIHSQWLEWSLRPTHLHCSSKGQQIFTMYSMVT